MSRASGERPCWRLVWLAAALVAMLAALPACDDASSADSSSLGVLSSSLQAASGSVVVELDLSRGLGERPPQMSFFGGPQPTSLSDLVLSVAGAQNQRATRGFFLRLGLASTSFAQAEELGRLLAALPDEQPVTCHAHGYSNVALLLAASACDEIWLSPAGEVTSVGIASQTLYLKRLLDRLKVHTDFLHMGKYKSAIEGFTREGPSDEAREALLGVLGSLRETWLDGITQGREGERVKHAAEHGPWTPAEALDRGLIDHVGYESDAREAAKKRSAADKVQTGASAAKKRGAAEELASLLRSLAGSSRSSGEDRIALLPTAGAIRMSGGGPFEDGGIVARSLIKTLERLRKDESVKAVVLRIDSPGGSALASDLIWHELMRLREEKPLIATLAGTAASGGYYMACAANQIVAERSTVLGSIGVFGGKVVIGDALDHFGVSGVTFAASDEEGAATRAAYLSPLTAWDEATREQVRAQMRHVYDLFLRRVAEGRHLPVESVHEVAQGRIWSGVQGQERGLVDAIGGVQKAIAVARELAELDDAVPVRIERGPEGLLELLGLDEDADEEAIAGAVRRLRASRPGPIAELAEPLLPHLESLSPLLGGERVLTAMPFSFFVH